MSPSPAPSAVSPARVVAFRAIRRTFESGAYTDRALRAEAAEAGLEGRDLALATTLAYGTVQRRGTLDDIIERLANRRSSRLDAAVLAALRLGLFQLLYLDRVPQHAAVDESVQLAKPNAGAGLVNAVLRRASREGEALLAAMGDETPERAAVAHSVPLWLARMWWDELGADEARALLAAINAPAEAALRVNTLVAEPREVHEALNGLGVRHHQDPGLPEGIVLDAPWDAHASPLWEDGAVMPQSRASMLVARTLAPRAGERVLDLCAAPGGKTTHLAALMAGTGEVVAVERHPGRAGALVATCARMHADIVRVQTADAAAPRAAGDGFDRVLVDPPCSGLGTLQSRPDLRWRVTPETIAGMLPVQAAILAAGADALAPGGTLVYSVCTISRAEGMGQIEALLARDPGLALDADPPVRHHQQLMPHRDQTDGFFIARVRRAA